MRLRCFPLTMNINPRVLFMLGRESKVIVMNIKGNIFIMNTLTLVAEAATTLSVLHAMVRICSFFVLIVCFTCRLSISTSLIPAFVATKMLFLPACAANAAIDSVQSCCFVGLLFLHRFYHNFIKVPVQDSLRIHLAIIISNKQ